MALPVMDKPEVRPGGGNSEKSPANTGAGPKLTLTIGAAQPRAARDRLFDFDRALRAWLVGCSALIGSAWLTSGYCSGCSMDSTARSTSSSGQTDDVGCEVSRR